MESDLAFRTIVKIGYPWIYRHDRGLYQKYDKLDPLEMGKNCMIASSIGYFIGKIMKRREKIYSALFCIPIIIKYAWDEWSLKDSQKNYSSFKIQVSQETRIKRQKNQGKQHQIVSSQKNKRFQITRKMPTLQKKIYCASDFMNQLNDSYFQ